MNVKLETTRRRIKWGEGKEGELISFVQEKQAEGHPIGEAIREFAQMNNINWLTARQRYYRILQRRQGKKRNKDHLHLPQGVTITASSGDPMLDAIATFLQQVRNLDDFSIQYFFEGLARLAGLATFGLRGDGIRKEMEEKDKALAALAEEVERLQAEVKHYQTRFSELQAQWETLNYLVDNWLNMRSVDKVTSMGDFGRRLKYQVDEFGTVVKVHEDRG